MTKGKREAGCGGTQACVLKWHISWKEDEQEVQRDIGGEGGEKGSRALSVEINPNKRI